MGKNSAGRQRASPLHFRSSRFARAWEKLEKDEEITLKLFLCETFACPLRSVGRCLSCML